MNSIETTRVVNKEVLELMGNYLVCDLCKLICVHPMNCRTCVINFCKSCLEIKFKEKADDSWTDASSFLEKCLKCERTFGKLPGVIWTFYRTLQIKCKNNGCNEVLLYDDLERHEKICCEFNVDQDSFMKSFENLEKLEESVQINENIESSITNELPIQNHLDQETENNYQLLPIENQGLISQYDEEDSIAFEKLSQNFLNSINEKNCITTNTCNNLCLQEKEDLKSRVENLEKICQCLLKEMKILKLTNPFFNNLQRVNNLNPENYILKNRNNFAPSNKGEILIYEKCDLCSNIVVQKSKLKCPKCSKSACSQCLISCQKCENWSCKDCSKCLICKTLKECVSCKSSCNQCIKTEPAFCSACILNCQLCENKFCKRCCSFKCKHCDKTACLKCSWNCRVCLSTFCKLVKNKICKFCGVPICLDCLSKCNSCEWDICLTCTNKCTRCDATTCNKCCVKTKSKCEITCKKCLVYN